MKVVRPGQIRAARALLGIKQSDLARAAAVSLATVNNLERGFADPRASTVDALSAALGTVGVDFSEQDGCDSATGFRGPFGRKDIAIGWLHSDPGGIFLLTLRSPRSPARLPRAMDTPKAGMTPRQST